MHNFPSKWFEFTNHKEIKRLRQDLNNTLSLKIEISASVIVAIISVFLQETITKAETYVKVLFCSILCLIVILIFSFPFIIKCFKNIKRHNIMIKGKDAINLFDDEISYNVLAAVEYNHLIESTAMGDTILNNELKIFYKLEIEYYVTESIKLLNLFKANKNIIIGEGKNQISTKRFTNIVNMICELIERENLSLDKEIETDFNIIKSEFSNVSTK